METKLYYLLFCTIFITSCKDTFNFSKDTKDPVIAKVGERSLFKSQLDELVHPGTSPTDSAAIIDGYVQNWVREHLMIIEAEKNVAADINLNKLVEDYRSSLLVYNYEKRLIETQLDTIIPFTEKMSLYEKNKSQYILSHPIIKCIVAKVPAKSADVGNIKSALSKSDLTEALFLIKDKATYHFLDTSNFMTIEDVNSLLPSNMIKADKLSKGKVVQEKSKEYEYFVKILKFYDENEIPPFDYIDAKITKTILSERKIELLRHYRQQLYDKGISQKDFEIFKPE